MPYVAWRDLDFCEGFCGRQLAESVHRSGRFRRWHFKTFLAEAEIIFCGAMSTTFRLELLAFVVLVAAAGAENGMTLCVLGLLPMSVPAAVEGYSVVALQPGRHP